MATIETKTDVTMVASERRFLSVCVLNCFISAFTSLILSLSKSGLCHFVNSTMEQTKEKA